MFDRLRRLFGSKKESAKSAAAKEMDERAWEAWHEEKSARMEALLGKEHDMVMHAIIPYVIGGGLDLYYYPNAVQGTGIATKEVCEAPGEGSTNRLWKNYELVMFTRHRLDLDEAKDETTPFGKAHHTMNAILNMIARYSGQASLNPGETCEFPAEMEGVGGKCLVFDAYPPSTRGVPGDFGLLAVILVHRSEMEFAREHNTKELLAKLEAAGHYPYSDLDRKPVA